MENNFRNMPALMYTSQFYASHFEGSPERKKKMDNWNFVPTGLTPLFVTDFS